MKRVTMLDYGAGNIASVKKALEHFGCSVKIVCSEVEFSAAERIVMPGVGNFSATARMQERGLRSPALDAIRRGVPFLGICVGLQWLFDGSEESVESMGAGILGGVCTRLPQTMKVPHVGWNTLEDVNGEWLLRGLPAGTYMYFTHSYAAPIVPETAAVTTHGACFTSALERGRLGAVQFHPEKSGDAGLEVLRNFLELPC